LIFINRNRGVFAGLFLKYFGFLKIKYLIFIPRKTIFYLFLSQKYISLHPYFKK